MPKQHSVTKAPLGYGHLILTRKANESIDIGSGLVKITVAEVRGNNVRISISAPRELKIIRTELETK